MMETKKWISTMGERMKGMREERKREKNEDGCGRNKNDETKILLFEDPKVLSNLPKSNNLI